MSLIPDERLLNLCMKFLPLLVIVSVTVLSLALPACKNTLSSSTGQTDIVFPDSNISYIRYVQPLFNLKCNFSGCHDDGTQAGGLSLTNYFSAISVPGVIVPKDTAHSILVQRITGAIQPMMPPPPSSPLTQNQIQGLKKWIAEGAKYN